MIFLSETGPMQWKIGQHCHYWWPGALAPGHQKPQCWVRTYAFPAVYGLSSSLHVTRIYQIIFIYLLKKLLLHIQHICNTLGPEQNVYCFKENIFRCIVLKEFCLKFLLKIVQTSALIKVMAWCWRDNKLLSEPVVTQSSDICFTGF